MLKQKEAEKQMELIKQMEAKALEDFEKREEFATSA